METKHIEMKVTRLKRDFADLCESLAKDFTNAARNARDGRCDASASGSSYLRDLPVIAKEIDVLEGLLRELKHPID